jgi:acetyltransferase-like isoleucine patch superfamily enzyme
MPIFHAILNKIIYRPYIKNRLNKCGSNFKISYSSEILNPQYFSIGYDFYAGPRTYFVTNKNNPVEIGNAVMFGPDCKIIGGNHDISFINDHMYYNKNIEHSKSKIVIEDGSWIGANSVILSNAIIGEGSIIGAMSLVNKKIPPYCISAGIPSKPLKRRFDKENDLEKILKNTGSKYSLRDILNEYINYKI